MNKNLPGVALLAAVAFLSSCSNDEPTEGYDIFSVDCGNYIVPDNGGGQPYAESASYYFDFKYHNSTVDMVCSRKNASVTKEIFKISNVKYSQKDYADGNIRSFSVESEISISDPSSDIVSHIVADVSSIFSFNPVTDVILDRVVIPSVTFRMGDSSVSSFSKSPYFGGITVTEYEKNGELKTFSNNQLVYSLFLDLETSKASAVYYNARFAQEMPRPITVGLSNLDITYEKEGYVVSGENVVPLMKEGGADTPMPVFVFNSFMLKTSGDNLRTAEVVYEVAGKYKGTANVSELIFR